MSEQIGRTTAAQAEPDGSGVAATGSAPAGDGSAESAGGEDFAALDSVDFLDDIDFSLEDVESRIAPLALAHL